jgi:hypothetical protein
MAILDSFWEYAFSGAFEKESEERITTQLARR